ncbi:MAG TPA: hypothetical protein VNM15_02615 [Candidatus Binatia bacterium]|nr:hypothetical protein [Candidatus Binatia bacterium]
MDTHDDNNTGAGEIPLKLQAADLVRQSQGEVCPRAGSRERRPGGRL